jgi:probable HAF family extracellular repeat protein
MPTRVFPVVLLTLLSSALSVLAAGADPVRFRVVSLGVAGDATGINESGAVTVTAPDGAFLVTGPRTVRISGAASATAVNDGGTVTGNTATSNQPYVWNSGDLRVLSSPSGSFASDLNNSNVVAGTLGAGFHAAIWRDGTPQLIFPGSDFSAAVGINNRGAVVGTVDNAAGNSQAYLWSASEGAQLLGDGANLGQAVDAFDINQRGVVVGEGFSGGVDVGFVFDPRFGLSRFELPPGALGLLPFAINDANWVVGEAFVPSDDEEHIPGPRGFVSFGFGIPMYLDELIRTGLPKLPGGSWEIESASDINSKGQIAATATHPRFGRLAVRLDPVEPTPEPATLLLLGTGAAAFGGRAWKCRRTRTGKGGNPD